jgi:hypothetical protein
MKWTPVACQVWNADFFCAKLWLLLMQSSPFCYCLVSTVAFEFRAEHGVKGKVVPVLFFN